MSTAKTLFAMSVSILVSFSMTNTALADSEKLVNPDNNHSYQLFDTKKTWRDAKINCENLGGYLATLTSSEENEWVFDRVASDQVSIWLGGTDRNSEGNWEWLNGETWDYTNWANSEPNDGNSYTGEDYLIFVGHRASGTMLGFLVGTGDYTLSVNGMMKMMILRVPLPHRLTVNLLTMKKSTPKPV